MDGQTSFYIKSFQIASGSSYVTNLITLGTLPDELCCAVPKGTVAVVCDLNKNLFQIIPACFFIQTLHITVYFILQKYITKEVPCGLAMFTTKCRRLSFICVQKVIVCVIRFDLLF